MLFTSPEQENRIARQEISGSIQALATNKIGSLDVVEIIKSIKPDYQSSYLGKHELSNLTKKSSISMYRFSFLKTAQNNSVTDQSYEKNVTRKIKKQNKPPKKAHQI